MSVEWNRIGPESLEFYARICASFSHDMRNMMAGIHESAGLVQDIAAKSGRKIQKADSEKISRASQRIVNQVKRSDEAVSAFNAFAHSSDEFFGRAELHRTVEVLIAVTKRPAAGKRVAVELRPGPESVSVQTSPFLLYTCLGRLIEEALEYCTENGALGIAPRRAAAGAVVQFEGLTGLEGADFPASFNPALLEALGAEISADSSAGTLAVSLPEDVNG